MLRLRHPIALLLISVLVLFGVLRSYSSPSPVGADAPDVVFSAARAEAILVDLLQENAPHVAGSPLNRVVRNRVVAHLEDAGYEPEIQALFHCNPMFGSCSPVENVIAVKPGHGGGQENGRRGAVLLTAHYDSGWAGPGAADDGAGTAAILEIARMAADFPPFANDIIFLITDSEENGLVGADAFAEHHPLFERVKAVVNLEARGVTGPSAMFETGEGNRSIIRVLAKNAERPVANSLVYEIYKRMPNDTDYTVYRRKGIMGLNFAFAAGVPLYHSVQDTVANLDPGSLQHHGDNAWSVVKALAERRLDRIVSREDAGYIDLFGMRLIHYPVSIAGGLAIFLGVWVMIAIALAFRREFRYRQLRWGLLAIPAMLFLIIAGAWLLAWPLGRWPELHPLEHPYPWAGRLALFGMLGLAGFTTLKVFTGRVSPCAWMILGWAVISVFALYLSSKLPTATHLALIPLAGFALGSVIDLFRKKSPAPLLMASLLGFAATAFIAFYHFFMMDVVMNFGLSHLKIIPFWLPALSVMPMLLAFVKKRDLTWKPAQWLGGAVLALCLVHFLLPAFTEDRPRDMTLMYSETEGEEQGYLVLESIYGQHDRSFADGHAFQTMEVPATRIGRSDRPVRPVTPLGLPGVEVLEAGIEPEQGLWRHRLVLQAPDLSPYLRLELPPDAGLQRAWVDGVLAVDADIESKHKRARTAIGLVSPGREALEIELLTSTREFTVTLLSWHELPPMLVAPFMGNWPPDAQPFLFGPRAEKRQPVSLGGVE
jgi:hypothetical protein